MPATLGLTKAITIDATKVTPLMKCPNQIAFTAKEINLVEWKRDILAVGVTEKDMVKDQNSKFENSILRKLDRQLGGLLGEVSVEEDFTGKLEQSTIFRILGFGSKRVGLIGLGKSPAGYKNLGEAAAAAAKSAQASNVDYGS